MSKAEYGLLQDVIMDEDFPDLDLALRRGRHIDRDDAAWYSLLTDAQELLEPFYRRYGCELIHKTDGYFYLLPTADKVSRKQLAATDMLVGQALALLYLDPAAVERGGVVTQEEVVAQLSAVLGSDALIGVFSPGKRKVKDERIAQRNVRQRVAEAVRRLAGLGFVELSDENAVRLRAALLRFAEPVRGLSEPAEALAKLVAQGEVALTTEDAADGSESSDDSDEPRESDATHEPDRTRTSAAASDDAAYGGSGVEPGCENDIATSQAADDREDAAAALAGERTRRGDTPVFPIERAVGSAFGDRAGDPGVTNDLPADGALIAESVWSAGYGDAHAADRDEIHRGDTLAGIGSPGHVVEDAADGGDGAPPRERSAVVRKPRAPVLDDDLDWADIVLPERDAEEGS